MAIEGPGYRCDEPGCTASLVLVTTFVCAERDVDVEAEGVTGGPRLFCEVELEANDDEGGEVELSRLGEGGALAERGAGGGG